jgi:hypothetical protein
MTPALEGLLGQLLAEVAEMRATLGEVLAALPIPETMTTGDIAARRGCSASWIVSAVHPWRLPNFGRPDEGEGVRRWRRETVREWYASPTWEADHRAEWKAMTPAERRGEVKA